MTAVAVVSAPWGVLMAADGRMSFPDDSTKLPDDQTQKILRISDPNRNVLYALVGLIGDGGFDARDELRRRIKELATQEFSNPCEYITSLCQPVATAMTNARYFPSSNGKLKDGRWNTVQVFFAGCFGALVCMVIGEYSHLNGLANFRITEYREDDRIRLCCGSGKVFSQMYDGNHSPIPNSPFSRYVYGLNGNPSVSQAKRFAVGYIEACCSPLGRKVDPVACKGIGGHIHVATVKPRSGFTWIIPPLSGTGEELEN